MKDDQVTLRLPRELARLLSRRAKERGVPKSQMVREAIQAYLADGGLEEGEAWRSVASLVGSEPLDASGIERDDMARRIRAHNWRD